MSVPAITTELKAEVRKAMNKEGICGYFQRVRTWSVKTTQEGIIVQHIKRTFDVTDVQTEKKLAGADLDNYVGGAKSEAYATETDYYELWRVDASGKLIDDDRDTFGLCALIPTGAKWEDAPGTTQGTFTMIGGAYFHPSAIDDATLQGYGFTQGAIKAAGALFSSSNAPTNLPAATSLPVTYTVLSKWDSTSTTSYSTVTAVSS